MRVIVAARLSTLQKNGSEGIGLDTQDKRSREWAEREGHEVVTIVADTRSGVIAPWDRKNLRPWVTDPAKMAAYDGIVAYRNDRLSRGVWADEARIRLWAAEHGKALMIVDGPQWPPRHDGDKWAWEAQAGQARKEWEAGRERSMRAVGELRERGKLTNKPPFGYVSAGVRYDHALAADWSLSYADPETGQRVHYAAAVFARVIAGETMPAIALWLDSQGVRTAQGNRWSPNRIAAMVRNPAYKGRACERDRRTGRYGKMIHACEPVVDAGTWKRANENLDARRGRGLGKAEAAERALLASVLACPACGAPMYRVRCGRAGRQAAYYRCAGTGAVRRSECRNMVPCGAADALVTRFAAALDAPVVTARVLPARDHAAEIEAVSDQLADLPRLGLDETEEDARRAELRAERRRLRELPAEPARTVWEAARDEAGAVLTYGGEFAALEPAQRGEWLRRRGLRAYAARTARGLAGKAFGPLLRDSMGAASLLDDGTVSVVVTWLGAGVED